MMQHLLLAQDKGSHYFWGTWAAVAGAHLAALFGLDRRLGALAGAVVIGALKEAADALLNKLKGEVVATPDPMDFLYTAGAGAVVALAM